MKTSQDCIEKTTKKYWAFISYSSRDKKWGKWLHNRLENYPIPKEFQGTEIFDGDPLGKNLSPCFRDRDELSGSSDLGPPILKALKNSRYLVVLCSKRSAKSKWVNKEIIDFKAIHPENEKRILALILDGEPNATINKDFSDSEECFPLSLRAPHEPLAGDLRKEGDGKERGFLKVLSGISQIGFDDLYNRHLRAQRKKRIIASSGAIIIISVLTGLSIFAFQQQSDAINSREATEIALKQEYASRIEEEKQRETAELQLSRSSMQQAVNLLHSRFPEDAREILKAIPIKHRAWEWYLLSAWCGPSCTPVSQIPSNSIFSNPFGYLKTQKYTPDESSKAFDAYYSPELRQDRGSISSVMINPGNGAGAEHWVVRKNPHTVMDMVRTRAHGSIDKLIPSSDASMILLTNFEHGNSDGLSSWSGRTYMPKRITTVTDRIETPLLFHYGDNKDLDFSDITYGLFQPGAQPQQLLRGLENRGMRSIFEGLKHGDIMVTPNPYRDATNRIHFLRSSKGRFNHIGSVETESLDQWFPLYIDHEAAAYHKDIIEEEPVHSWRGSTIKSEIKIVFLEMVRNGNVVLECWNIENKIKLWSIPWEPYYPMTRPSFHIGRFNSESVIFLTPSLKILRLSDGKVLFNPIEPDRVVLGLTGNARSTSSTGWLSPHGDYAICYSYGYFDTNLVIFRLSDGKQIYWHSNEHPVKDELLLKQINKTNQTLEASRLGTKRWPRALIWETSGDYVAVQMGDTNSRVSIYNSLLGSEIKTGLSISLNFDWSDPKATKFEINESLNRIILGPFLLEKDSWKPILKFPEGTLIFWDWSVAALKMNDGCYELVHLPLLPKLGYQQQEPRNLQEYLLFQEYDFLNNFSNAKK